MYSYRIHIYVYIYIYYNYLTPMSADPGLSQGRGGA